MYNLLTACITRYSIGTLQIRRAFLYDWMVFQSLLNKPPMCSTTEGWSIPKRMLNVLWNMHDPGVFVSSQKSTW